MRNRLVGRDAQGASPRVPIHGGFGFFAALRLGERVSRPRMFAVPGSLVVTEPTGRPAAIQEVRPLSSDIFERRFSGHSFAGRVYTLAKAEARA